MHVKKLEGDVSFYSIDVSDHKIVKAWAEEILKEWGSIDILVK